MAVSTSTSNSSSPPPPALPGAGADAVLDLEAVTIRFCGDSGDGMQLVGSQFSAASAALGNDISVLPDFPSEIRAPAGTLAGVSGFQVQVSSTPIHTPGDRLDALVAMNPAALQANLKDLEPGGLLLVNDDAFIPADLIKAGFTTNPLKDGALAGYNLLPVPITTLNREAVAGVTLSPRDVDRCKNFFALGLVSWVYERSLTPTLRWIGDRFAKNPAMLEANRRSLKAGYHFGETANLLPVHYRIGRAPIAPGVYRKLTGTEAIAFGLIAAASRAQTPLLYAAYPITPATEILHSLAELSRFGVRTIQAEDEQAAIAMAVGAAFGGAIAATATSGPGVCLKSEVIGLAVMTELPVVVINVQRGGPSTGLPTKTEQADLLQACFGRNGESPVVLLAARSPADCFTMTLEAVRLAVRYMTPVILLSDGYLANGAEPWRIPLAEDLPIIQVKHPSASGAGGVPAKFQPYQRDERLARPWAIPGTPGLEHRTGGLEKEAGTGNVNYDPLNHEAMVRVRAAKIAGIAADIPEVEVDGPLDADVLVVGWGSTYGAITTAVERVRRHGCRVAHVHLNYLNPLPRNLGEVLARGRRVLVPELNGGQLLLLLRATYLVDARGLSKIQGRPFLVAEIETALESELNDARTAASPEEQPLG